MFEEQAITTESRERLNLTIPEKLKLIRELIKQEQITDEDLYTSIRDVFFYSLTARKCIGKYTLQEIEVQICEHLNTTPEKLSKKSRELEIILPRQMAHYKGYFLTKAPLRSIGWKFGRKDHATILNSVRSIQNLLDTDKRFRVCHQQFLTT